jgi:hypothetical protein
MPMKKLYDFDQSEDKFEREPQGACQAWSARWIVSRALWEVRRDGEWKDRRWMGEKRDMEAHVWRIYTATRAARAAVASEERDRMEKQRQLFAAEKQAAVKRQRRMMTGSAAVQAASAPAAATAVEPVPAGFAPADLDARLNSVYIPTLPRMLDALRNDIEEQGGLDGAVHTYDDVAPARAAHMICALGAGYKLIEIRDEAFTREGGAHAIAAELRPGQARLFDPNVGEYESQPPGSAWESFGALVTFLLGSAYKLASIRYLSVIHFPLKREAA